uniref:C-type lectin domain-containing protein n=1 Tax=Hucho hucho TaxID=62062 RepID=A0A4W5QTT3_9TELE
MVMLTISLLLCAAFALSGAAVLVSVNLLEENTEQTPLGAEEKLMVRRAARRPCPEDYLRFGSRCFLFVETERNWPDAELHCVSLGANLASVHSYADYQHLQAVVANTNSDLPATWIGGYEAVQLDGTKDRQWFWTDGSKFDYHKWNKGEPNNYKGSIESCILMNWADEKGWNDSTCRGNVFPSVCSLRTIFK